MSYTNNIVDIVNRERHAGLFLKSKIHQKIIQQDKLKTFLLIKQKYIVHKIHKIIIISEIQGV